MKEMYKILAPIKFKNDLKKGLNKEINRQRELIILKKLGFKSQKEEERKILKYYGFN